jgi:predicted HD phosphohydrolase
MHGQAALAGASQRVVVAALLHDVGWKLARADPTAEAAMTSGAAAAVSEEAPEADCLAAKLGILSHCGIFRKDDGDGNGNDEAKSAAPGEEQLRAQHDVIGGCWLRMRGFHEDVAHVTEGHVLAKRYLCHKEPSCVNR